MTRQPSRTIDSGCKGAKGKFTNSAPRPPHGMSSKRDDRIVAVIAQIEACPGSNLRQIHRITGVPLSTTARLLDKLEMDGVVKSENGSSYRRFYPVGKGLHKRERVLLGFLTKPRPRGILEGILREPGIRHSDLADSLGLPPPTLTYYLKQIVAKDLVVVRKKGVARHYRVKNPEMLEKALERTEAGYDPELA